MVLMDRVDEPHMTGGKPELMRRFVWPMLDNKLLKHPGNRLQNHAALRSCIATSSVRRVSFTSEPRLDKQNVIPAFQWTGESLYDLARARMLACAAEGRSPEPKDLFADDVSYERLLSAFQSLRVPRHLFRLALPRPGGSLQSAHRRPAGLQDQGRDLRVGPGGVHPRGRVDDELSRREETCPASRAQPKVVGSSRLGPAESEWGQGLSPMQCPRSCESALVLGRSCSGNAVLALADFSIRSALGRRCRLSPMSDGIAERSRDLACCRPTRRM